jgi:hypothetical protein
MSKPVTNLLRKEVLELEDNTDSSEEVEWVADTNRINLRSSFRPKGVEKYVDKPVEDIADKLFVECLKIITSKLDNGTIEIVSMGINNLYTGLRAIDILLNKAKFLKDIEVRRVRRGTDYEKEDLEKPGQVIKFRSYLYGIMVVLRTTLSDDDLAKLTELLSLTTTNTAEE